MKTKKFIIREITHLLSSMGVPNSYTGVKQIAYAVALALERPEYLTLVTKRLYPKVAKYSYATPTSVERNIRTVVQIIWENNPDALNNIAGYELKQKPTNSKFIAILADYMQR